MQNCACAWIYCWIKKLWKIRTGPLGCGAVVGHRLPSQGAAGVSRAAGLLLAKPTFLVRFWAYNRGWGLSTRPSPLGVDECMVCDQKSGHSVFLLIYSFLPYLRNYIPIIVDIESPFPGKGAQNIVSSCWEI